MCDHNVVITWIICSSATTDLSLATLLQFLSPFSWQEKPLLLRRGTGVFFLHPHPTRLFRRTLQLCLSARRESNEHGKGTSAKWASVEQRDAVRLYVSKTNFPVLSAVTLLNKRTRNCLRVCRQLSHEITKKRRLNLQTVHACIYITLQNVSQMHTTNIGYRAMVC